MPRCRRLGPVLPENVKLLGAEIARPNSNSDLCAASGDGGAMVPVKRVDRLDIV